MEHRLNRLEAVQTTILEIGQLSTQSDDISEFLRAVHMSLSRIMYAVNFYVALYHPRENTIQFAYFVDETVATPNFDHRQVMDVTGPSLTAQVIHHGKPLLITDAEIAALAAEGRILGVGPPARQWMGCPLFDHQKQVLGAIVIQSYDARHEYSQEDQALFGLIANHVANALEGFQSLDRLERAVEERTVSLAHEIAERRHAEAIQRALYEITELSFGLNETMPSSASRAIISFGIRLATPR